MTPFDFAQGPRIYTNPTWPSEPVNFLNFNSQQPDAATPRSQERNETARFLALLGMTLPSRERGARFARQKPRLFRCVRCDPWRRRVRLFYDEYISHKGIKSAFGGCTKRSPSTSLMIDNETAGFLLRRRRVGMTGPLGESGLASLVNSPGCFVTILAPWRRRVRLFAVPNQSFSNTQPLEINFGGSISNG